MQFVPKIFVSYNTAPFNSVNFFDKKESRKSETGTEPDYIHEPVFWIRKYFLHILKPTRLR